MGGLLCRKGTAGSGPAGYRLFIVAMSVFDRIENLAQNLLGLGGLAFTGIVAIVLLLNFCRRQQSSSTCNRLFKRLRGLQSLLHGKPCFAGQVNQCSLGGRRAKVGQYLAHDR